ncbi:MAG: hypothetical protein DMG37_14715 [Acidobacteria bacterium]|nr:MAG: hypothetical protein DMG37_14715 [Acidobacteriota bacterium]
MTKKAIVKSIDWWARGLAIAGLCFSVFTWWHGQEVQRKLEAAYFNSQLGPIESLSAGATPTARLGIKNTGKSRAKVDGARATLLAFDSENRAIQRIGEIQPLSDLPTRAEINEGGEFSSTLRLGHVITAAEFTQIQSKNLSLFVVGDVEYWDAFNNRHVFTFCHRFEFEHSAWVGCSVGNETHDL